uniref:Uncharacterized protein n=1 Tax=Picea glauca TaxID=3330 RepID=A0A101M4B5_PICGL|nr:hypothetical protein ABT39_MTgene501 [Picea glauca]
MVLYLKVLNNRCPLLFLNKYWAVILTMFETSRWRSYPSSAYRPNNVPALTHLSNI